MKKKLLEKDIFYLSLFICICLIALGGILFTNNNLNKLTSDKDAINKDDEINLIKDDNKDDDKTVATSTESNQNLQQAKAKKQTEAKSESKMSYVGDGILREYSDTMPTYSKTLDVWEVHKGLDVSAQKGSEIKSILNGKVVAVYSDDRYGTCIELSYDDGLRVIYSGVQDNVSLKKGDTVKEGDCIAYVGNTTNIENEDGIHVHIEAYKNNVAIDPLSLLE